MTLFPAILLLSFASLLAGPAPNAATNAPSPVVVELFTSEGCSDCPPADNLLSAFAADHGANVIPLAFHVTYWDNAAWRDRFSDMRYTQRQASYVRDFHIQSAYTPQAVVDGRFQVVGNDASAVNGAIHRAAAEAMPVAVDVSINGDSAKVAAHSFNPSIGGRVLYAITEDGLSTEVKGGENRSRTLHHNAVVRSLEDAGALDKGAFSRTLRLKLNRGWQRDHLHVVVLVQDATGRILGAASVPLVGENVVEVRSREMFSRLQSRSVGRYGPSM